MLWQVIFETMRTHWRFVSFCRHIIASSAQTFLIILQLPGSVHFIYAKSFGRFDGRLSLCGALRSDAAFRGRNPGFGSAGLWLNPGPGTPLGWEAFFRGDCIVEIIAHALRGPRFRPLRVCSLPFFATRI